MIDLFTCATCELQNAAVLMAKYGNTLAQFNKEIKRIPTTLTLLPPQGRTAL